VDVPTDRLSGHRAVAAALLSMSDAERLNLTTARGAGNPFLFPGRDAGQPMHTTSLRLRLRTLTDWFGHPCARRTPPRSARTRRRRNARLPPHHTQALAAEVGATWKRYAPGGQVW